MIVKCITNKMSDVAQEFLAYSPAEDENDQIDMLVGKSYVVFAVRESDSARWYFTHTETFNQDTFWWMPSSIFEVLDDKKPNGWEEFSDDRGTLLSYPSLQNWRVEEGIIDGDREALSTYLKQVEADPTFPTETDLSKYNEEFIKQARIKEYEKKVNLAKEKGWEYPEKPSE